MTTFKTLTVLFAAAVLEAGGDALIRKGLHASTLLRIKFWLAGAGLLFAYGWAVNTPPWDFGRLLGVYIVFFFFGCPDHQLARIRACTERPAGSGRCVHSHRRADHFLVASMKGGISDSNGNLNSTNQLFLLVEPPLRV